LFIIKIEGPNYWYPINLKQLVVKYMKISMIDGKIHENKYDVMIEEIRLNANSITMQTVYAD
jgi:hypothetical protein